ncbi:ArsJ-associated glyceraldehyde-3-phosphate dehydrogenase [Gammaproteobacteria bacterium]|nr:ArsJ-associated glyceraldehyde-3-phosphate dehydrogenase [Gammaproteobacteria bacterium]
MNIKVGINGFGRMGRLGLRVGWAKNGYDLVHINEPAGSVDQAAHLLEFDSIHGRWDREITSGLDRLSIDGVEIGYSRADTPAKIHWEESGVDIVLECSGKYKSIEELQPHFNNGAKKVIVSAPIKDPEALNVVMGVNDHLYKNEQHNLITGASCTTNCLAPIIKVMLENFKIRHGVITTIHDVTNTQTLVDGFHADLRRARSGLNALIPTSTGSATAITQIYPELLGKLNGLAVRVPILNSSLTDCVFEVDKATTSEELNTYFRDASVGNLKNILGFEERPLVSTDYVNDPRSAIIDGLSTMVVDGTQVKILAWYDNEWGYMTRLMELTEKISYEC